MSSLPLEDDSWLDKEIEEEEDERMKNVMRRVKRSMQLLSNEKKRQYISDERQRFVERQQYANDINNSQVRACMSCIFFLLTSPLVIFLISDQYSFDFLLGF